MAAMGSKKAKQSEEDELAALRAQLQFERAQLTSEISSRLGSLSPSKSSGAAAAASRTNPFSMGSSSSSATNGGTSFTSAAASSSSPFIQRPATLGLGAEMLDQDRRHAMNSTENARLRGAIVGKRKREEENGASLLNGGAGRISDDDEEESRTRSVQQKGKGKVKGETFLPTKKKDASKSDPFTSKKAKAKGTPLLEESTRAANTGLTEGSAPKIANGAPTEEEMQRLSKSARKRLRKKLREKAGGAGKEDVKDDEKTDPVSPEVKEKVVNGKASTEELQAMTPHQKSLMSHLSGARFRQINETLYTTTSSSALEYIQGEPSKLSEYHEGFREQVKGWPKVPVRQIAELLQKGEKKARMGGGGGGGVKGKMGRHASAPLVVDLGAGEAILAKLLNKDKSSAIRVLSYDLLDSEDGWVRGLDIAKLNGLPLPGALVEDSKAGEGPQVVDVAVFCLSLMGTNWVEMVIEARRVLRMGGELIVAEVTSRFNTKEAFIELVSSIGFDLRKEDSSNTHFVLFEFEKTAGDNKSGLRDELHRSTLVEQGTSILKPCIYKRR